MFAFMENHQDGSQILIERVYPSRNFRDKNPIYDTMMEKGQLWSGQDNDDWA
jgi:hypothetical protein